MVSELIKFGKENAITRAELCSLTGLPDRAIRKEIAELRESGELIINDQDGRGYYRSNDIEDLKKQYQNDIRRAKSILAQTTALAHKIDFLEREAMMGGFGV